MANASPAELRRARFDEIVAQHGAALTRLCTGYEREPAMREELMQEILLALWRALERFRGDASLRTWMYRVAHNVATTHCHRAQREPRTTEVVDECSGESPHTRVEASQRLAQLHAAIHTLGHLDRQLVLLYLEEIPQAEIADITGISITNVATRLGRSKAQLARALGARSTR